MTENIEGIQSIKGTFVWQSQCHERVYFECPVNTGTRLHGQGHDVTLSALDEDSFGGSGQTGAQGGRHRAASIDPECTHSGTQWDTLRHSGTQRL